MELRQIWTILLRRWWLVLLPPLVVAVLSLQNWQALISPPVSYSTSARFIVGQPPEDPATGFDPRYYSWLTSEYIANGLEEWVHGQDYAELVSRDLAERHGLALTADQIQGAIVGDSGRSVLVVYFYWATPGELAQIADSAVHVLSEQNAQAFPQLGGRPVVATLLELAPVGANAPGLRERLDLPLRVGLGFLAGLALAFVVDYLDPALRTRGEVEGLGLSVIGEIPRKRWWR